MYTYMGIYFMKLFLKFRDILNIKFYKFIDSPRLFTYLIGLNDISLLHDIIVWNSCI